MLTTHGEIILKLHNETPLHRDNFIKIVKEGVLDSALFHRVIENFMIQGGDTDSKNASPEDTLGMHDLPYEVAAEITPKLFHKKGVLAAARGGHPERVSSSTQFYIVQGKVFNDSTLDIQEGRINKMLAEHFIKQDSIYKDQLDSIYAALEAENWETYSKLNTRFRNLSEDYTDFERYTIPEAHREVYKTIGGTPHLDQSYSIFGEVVSGLHVVDSIESVATSPLDRPLQDVRILSVSILEE